MGNHINLYEIFVSSVAVYNSHGSSGIFYRNQ